MRVTSVHIQRHWWKYVLSVVAFMMLWTIVFDSLSAPRKNEKIRIFYLGEQLDCRRLEDELSLILPGLTDQKIKEISVENPVGEVNRDFYSILATRVYGADIIIFEEDLLTDDLVKTHFLPLPSELTKELFDQETLYAVDGVPYGFRIPSERLSRFYDGDKSCCAFLTHSSVNAAGIYGCGNVYDDAALRIVQYWMGTNEC